MSQNDSLGDGRSFKSHLDVFKDASEIKLSVLHQKTTQVLSEDEKLEKKATLKEKKADQS